MLGAPGIPLTDDLKKIDARPVYVITDGEFAHLAKLASGTERRALLRQLVLREFGRINGVINTALGMGEDRQAWRDTLAAAAAARDAAIHALLPISGTPPQTQEQGNAVEVPCAAKDHEGSGP